MTLAELVLLIVCAVCVVVRDLTDDRVRADIQAADATEYPELEER